MKTVLLKSRPGTTLAVLFVAASLAYVNTGEFRVSDEPDIRMALPIHLGNWTGEDILFCQERTCLRSVKGDDLADSTNCPTCGGRLDAKAFGENTILPPDVEIVRKQYTHTDGRSVTVTLVAGGKQRESIHRPQRCLVAQGSQILDSSVRKFEMSGRESPLSVMVLELMGRGPKRPGTRARARGGYFAYWFAGQGRETPYHLERMFWMGSERLLEHRISRWSYIGVSGPRSVDDHRGYLRTLSEVIRLLAPAIRDTPASSPDANQEPPAQ